MAGVTTVAVPISVIIFTYFLSKKFLKKKHSFNEELKPFREKKRYRCPFRGFFQYDPILIEDQKGNSCPLLRGTLTLCEMEVRQEVPDWDKCKIASKEGKAMLIKEAITRLIVFPYEFCPDGDAWDGISFERWLKYILEK
ncbi:MAG: hypothetical protein Q7R98_00745 [Candidatus Jorgensenbacteria bacterium]|nr:hypothetical protein [Candidatus Jorgensenbacteria bacterium]